MRAREYLLVMLPGLLACPPPDAAPDAGEPSCMELEAGACVQEPVPPALPALADWTCPTGWQAVSAYTLDDVERTAGHGEPHRACEPDAPAAACAVGTLPVLDDTACQDLGDTCPGDGWPAVVAGSGTTYFVRAGAAGGDGSSRDSPLATIGEALGRAVDGDTVAIAAGTYAEALVVARAVTLHGACARDVVIQAPSASNDRGTIELTGGGGALVRDLSLTGARVGLWILQNTDEVRVQGVHVRQARMVGVFASDGGHGLLQRVRVEDTQPDDGDEMGRGVQIRSRGALRLERCAIEGNRDLGLTVSGQGSRLELVDSIVRDTRSQASDSAWGLGMELLNGAAATIERSLFSGNRNTGLAVAHPGSALQLVDVVVQDTLSQESNGLYGGGMEVGEGAQVHGERVLLRRNHAIAVVTGGLGTTVEFVDLVIRDTEGRAADGVFGNGLSLMQGSRVILRRAVLAGNRFAELLVSSPASVLDVEDVILRQTRPQQSDGLHGSGLEVNSGAQVAARRLLVERTADSALHLAAATTSVQVQDLTVLDSGSDDPLANGYGVNAQTGAQVVIERAHIERPRTVGLAAIGAGTALTLRDLTLLDVRADPQGAFGRGLNVQEGASLLLERGRIERARETGVFGGGQGGTVVDLRHLRVLDTRSSSSAMAEGRGVSVQEGAVAWLGPALIAGSREVGAFVIHPGSRLTLEQTWIQDTTRAGAQPFGHGVTARDGARLDVLGCTVTRSADVGAAYANASGRVVASRIVDNAVGVFAGEGSTLREVADAPQEPGPQEVYVDQGTQLVDNQTRVGSGTVPLPDLLGQAPD